MIARSGVYFGTPFKVQCVVTQGELLSPTIFNVVVDGVLYHWALVIVEAEEETDPEGFN